MLTTKLNDTLVEAALHAVKTGDGTKEVLASARGEQQTDIEEAVKTIFTNSALGELLQEIGTLVIASGRFSSNKRLYLHYSEGDGIALYYIGSVRTNLSLNNLNSTTGINFLKEVLIQECGLYGDSLIQKVNEKIASLVSERESLVDSRLKSPKNRALQDV